MARATFSEHWHRIRELAPRLRSGVLIRPVWHRGERWHVLGDPMAGRFHRLSRGAYAFAGRLDGSRTVHDAWTLAETHAGDDAPTQGEAVAILGQLWSTGLLVGEAPPDVIGLLERAGKSRRREVAAGSLSVLFPRIPLVDPDRFLTWLTRILGWVYTPLGAALWSALLALGIAAVGEQRSRFADQFRGALDPPGAIWGLLAFVIAKLIHELGHGVACKAMARREHVPARIPTLGVMILVGVPSPYVDATAAWALRSKWRRALVGAAGMHAELALASVAAIIWSVVGPGPLSEWAFSTILIASITTLLFNANPLLRYDGYYILSDLAEIPNLSRRATDHLWHLASRHIWGLRRSLSPARDRAEAAALTIFALASTAYRFVLAWTITAFVWNRVPVVGTLIGIVALATLIVAPLALTIRRIVSGDELASVRVRAVTTTIAALLAIVLGLGLIPVPRAVTATGYAFDPSRTDVHAQAPGVLTMSMPSGMRPWHEGANFRIENPEVDSAVRSTVAALRIAELQRIRALASDPSEVLAWESRAEALTAQHAEALRLRQSLAPILKAGIWIAEPDARIKGAHIARGQLLGSMYSDVPTSVRIELTEAQTAAIYAAEGDDPLPVRLRAASGRGGVETGVLKRIAEPAGEDRSFRATVGLAGSGLAHGERVIARIGLPATPLLPRWIDAIRRTLLQRDAPR